MSVPAGMRLDHRLKATPHAAPRQAGAPSHHSTFIGSGCARVPCVARPAMPALAATAAGVTSDQSSEPAAPPAPPPSVVLTREAGKNGKLLKALQGRGIPCLEMPLVETSKGPDRDQLPQALQDQSFDWVCITSPEAANVFMEGWRLAGRPDVRVAVVGEGTGRVLVEAEGEALTPQFTPSVANAEHFGPELPFLPGGSNRVLYPASNKASSLLQEGLIARGFEVHRLNTYDTLAVTHLAPDTLQLATQAKVVAVASPSAVRAWVQLAGEEAAAGVAVACIGSTSARAAAKLNLQRVFFPEEPSLDNFVASIVEALGSCT